MHVADLVDRVLLGLGFAALLLPVPVLAVDLDGRDLPGVTPLLEAVLLLLQLEGGWAVGRGIVLEQVARLGVEKLDYPLLLLLPLLDEPRLLGETLGATRPYLAVGGEAPVATLADHAVEAVAL